MQQSAPQTLEQIRALVFTRLIQLIDQVSIGTSPADSWDQARQALEALPLAAEEAAVMRNRFANARSYLEAGERGAASYELRLLACRLANR
jgi:hypothetical protein